MPVAAEGRKNQRTIVVPKPGTQASTGGETRRCDVWEKVTAPATECGGGEWKLTNRQSPTTLAIFSLGHGGDITSPRKEK